MDEHVAEEDSEGAAGGDLDDSAQPGFFGEPRGQQSGDGGEDGLVMSEQVLRQDECADSGHCHLQRRGDGAFGPCEAHTRVVADDSPAAAQQVGEVVGG